MNKQLYLNKYKVLVMKKVNALSYIIMFVMIIILSLPLYCWSFQIQSLKITKVGDVIVNCNYPAAWGCRYSRPVMVKLTYLVMTRNFPLLSLRLHKRRIDGVNGDGINGTQTQMI